MTQGHIVSHSPSSAVSEEGRSAKTSVVLLSVIWDNDIYQILSHYLIPSLFLLHSFLHCETNIRSYKQLELLTPPEGLRG